jgi:osmoprotectant transport system ATP-binding protein
VEEPWVLVVDADRRPLGWAAVGDLPEGGTLADATLTPLGHTFSLVGDSARAALDSALLSPSRLAVGVDAEGAVIGVADAYELSAAMAGDGAAAVGNVAAADVAAGDVAAAEVEAAEVAAGDETVGDEAVEDEVAKVEAGAKVEAVKGEAVGDDPAADSAGAGGGER